MLTRPSVVACSIVALVFGLAAHAQMAGEREPIPRLEAGGPMSPVRALAFSPDGRTLYEAGFDKVVRVWTLDPTTGKFQRDTRTFRVPVGPGWDGAINALAVSSDGDWLAVAGLGAVRGRAGFQQIGLVAAAANRSDAMREDEGMIHVFHTRKPEVRRLRGHRGAVLALAFAPARAQQPPVLVSAARESDTNGAESSVLRLWDVERQTELAQRAFQPNFRGRQDLTVWHTGAAPDAVGVAVAWGDAHVRFWEPARQQLRQPTSSFAFGVTALPSVEKVAVLTHQKTGGQVEFWNTRGEPSQAEPHVLLFPEGHYPLTLRLLDRPAAGRWGRAAVVVRVPAQEDSYLLHVVDLEPRSPRPLQATLPLWKESTRLPVLAVAPAGNYLAVSGASDPAVRVFAVADLQAGGKPAGQLLQSAGTGFRQAAFATNGPERGLLLAETTRRKPGEPPAALGQNELLFNVTRRTLSAPADGWKIDALALGPWRVRATLTPAEGKRLATWAATVTRDGVAHGRSVVLEGMRGVTDFALRPPDALVPVPLLAVAFLDEVGQPTLALYNATTGAEVRQLAGHVEPIRALAFSGDGRLLVSTGDDQTVCVWSLTSLLQHLGRRGTLRGVAVREDQGKLVVADLARGSTAHGKLQPGQAFEGFVDAGKLRRLSTRAEFLDALLLKRPGDTVTLRLAAGRDVSLPVEQAVDEWKPLFSLFVTQPNRGGERGWVGWNPTGPYDARDPSAERFLGWHFNPTQADAPVTFAAVEQYRERRLRKGILSHLLVEGTLSGALAAWEKADRARPVPETNLRLWLDEGIGLDPRQADGQGRFVVRRPPTALHLVIDDLPTEHLGSATWQIDGLTATPRAFPSGPRTVTANLAELPWKRGPVRVRAVVRTGDDEPREVSKELLVYYQPPPPTVTLLLPDGQKVSAASLAALRQLEVAKPEFRLRAEVAPGPAGQSMTVQLTQSHQAKEAFTRQWHSEKKLVIDEPIRCLEGENLVEVRACNQDAPADADAETDRVALMLVYTRPVPEPAPRIVLEAVQAGQGAKRGVEPGRPVVVEVPQVQLQGTITGIKDLTEADWTAAGKSRPLTEFVAGKDRQFTIREPIRLVPGSQKVQLRARTAASEQARVEVELFYRPQLPAVVLEPLERLEFHEGDDPAHVTLRGRWLPPEEPHAFRACLFVNDRETHALETRDAWSVKVPLQPGSQRLQVQWTNEWGAVSTSEAVLVRFLRVPRVLKVNNDPKTVKPFSGPLSAQVQSALDLDPTGTEIELNGRKIGHPAELTRDAKVSWQVGLRDVPLREGDNTVRLWVRNTDGRCRTPGEWTIRYTPPPQPPPPPEVVFLDPARDVNWTARTLAVRLRVQSAGTLRSVVLSRDGRQPLRQVFDASKLPHTGQNVVFSLRVELTPDARAAGITPLDVTQLATTADGARAVSLPWSLLPGPNRLRLEAVNEGGIQTTELIVNWLYQPVRLSLTHLVAPSDAETVELPPDLRNVPAAPAARVTLAGVLTWDDDRTDLFTPSSRVRARVNGFKLPPVALSPARARVRRLEFALPLVLPRAEQNVVEIELLDVKVDGPARREFRLDCRKPEAQPQQLHLLILRPGDPPKDDLARRVTAALQPHAEGDVVIHGPFTGAVRRGQVLNELVLIKQQIDLRARRGLLNNLLVVYYEGAETISALGHFFPASTKPSEHELRRDALTCDSLADYVAEMAGAQLLLFDVAQTGTTTEDDSVDRVVHWPHSARPGVFRYRLARFEGLSAGHALLLTDLRKAVPGAPHLEGVAARVAANFRDVLPESTDASALGSVSGTARGHTPSNRADVLYDWHYPASYAGLRLTRAP